MFGFFSSFENDFEVPPIIILQEFRHFYLLSVSIDLLFSNFLLLSVLHMHKNINSLLCIRSLLFLYLADPHQLKGGSTNIRGFKTISFKSAPFQFLHLVVCSINKISDKKDNDEWIKTIDYFHFFLKYFTATHEGYKNKAAILMLRFHRIFKNNINLLLL